MVPASPSPAPPTSSPSQTMLPTSTITPTVTATPGSLGGRRGAGHVHARGRAAAPRVRLVNQGRPNPEARVAREPEFWPAGTPPSRARPTQRHERNPAVNPESWG
jgi:hypothetical protein